MPQLDLGSFTTTITDTFANLKLAIPPVDTSALVEAEKTAESTAQKIIEYLSGGDLAKALESSNAPILGYALLWEKLRERLVGHSIIPDMVEEIKEQLNIVEQILANAGLNLRAFGDATQAALNLQVFRGGTGRPEGGPGGMLPEIDLFAGGGGGGGEDVNRLSEAHQRLIDKMTAENAVLTVAKQLYADQSAGLAEIEAQLKIESALRDNKITQQEAERSGLAKLLQTNRDLTLSIEGVEKVKRSTGEEMALLQARIDAGGRETEQYRIQVRQLAIKARYGQEAADAALAQSTAVEKLSSQLQATTIERDLADIVEQQRLLLQYGGQETEQYRTQLRLLELKRDLGLESVSQIPQELQEQARLAEQQATALEKLGERQAMLNDLFRETSNLFASSAARGIADATFQAKSFADAMQDVVRSFARAVTEALIFRTIMLAIGSPGTAGQAGTGFLGFLFAGGTGGETAAAGQGAAAAGNVSVFQRKQHGGSVSPGRL
jgi:hypothetical protein